jgi:hypothetical protein
MIVGTNYYIRRKKPTIRECVHVCKQSFGWRTHWQATGNGVGDWPRWCDDEPTVENHELPWAIHSVEDIRAYLETGDWELVDEYGEVYEDWKAKLDALERWDGGKAEWNRNHPEPVMWETSEPRGSRDRRGNVFDEEAFA